MAGQSLTLHEDPRSGNCYKIKLTAALVGKPLDVRQYDIMSGETRTDAFLADINPNGRIPVLQIGEGADARYLPESNAACWYLGSGTSLVPEDAFAQADMLRWMFFEQYNHEPNVATMRFWMRFVGEDNLNEEQRLLLPAKKAAGEAALQLLDDHLACRAFLCGDIVTLADIALYPYSHVAQEGGFAMDGLGNLKRWFSRMEDLAGFVPMPA